MRSTGTIVGIVLLVLLLVLLLGGAAMMGFGGFGFGRGMMGTYGMPGFGIFGIGMLVMGLFWVLILVGAVWLVVTLARGSQGQPASGPLLPGAAAGQTPLDILKARYARGEITKEQFEEMKRDLGA